MKNPRTSAWAREKCSRLRATKNYQKAISDYNEAIRLNPNSPSRTKTVDRYIVNRGNNGQAQSDFQPDFCVGFVELAVATSRLVGVVA
jgi:tetratricopeptide (TPR) repeat protein